MRLRLLPASLAFATSVLTAAQAENWADIPDDGGAYAASKAVCRKVKNVRLPSLATVGTKTSKQTSDCDSESLYYGIGRAADPVAARVCALAHLEPRAGTPDEPMDGAAMLATIYANGAGVPRDYDIAIGFACQLDGAPAEMDGRINHLAKLQAKGPGTIPFDICDDITSGMMMGQCAQRASSIAAVARRGKIASLTRDLDPSRRASFADLQKKEAAFVTAVGDNETDMSGTARGQMVAEAQDAHEDAYVATLEAVIRHRLTPTTAEETQNADKALNRAYKKTMALKDTSGLGTVDKAGIKTTQRLWLAYRDAFVAFAGKDSASGPAVAAILTKHRTKDLAAFTN